MSFILHPGVLRSMDLYGKIAYGDISDARQLFFVGAGKDDGLFLYHEYDKWIIAPHVVFSLRIEQENRVLEPFYQGRYGNGANSIYNAWTDGYWSLFYGVDRWILREGYSLNALFKPSENTFYGHIPEYWSCVNPGFREGEKVVFTSNTDPTDILTLTYIYPRWEGANFSSADPAGTYIPKDGMSGTRIVGSLSSGQKKTIYMGEVAICW